jgi:hypothetical protein
LRKLNDVLKEDAVAEYKEGTYETIWGGGNHEFITFELKRFTGIKLAIGAIGYQDLRLIFMADEKFTQLDGFRFTMYSGSHRKRLKTQLPLSGPIPDDDEDKTPLQQDIDFSKEESMKYFREDMRNFPDILAKRVRHHLDQWRCEELRIIEFLEKHVKDV